MYDRCVEFLWDVIPNLEVEDEEVYEAITNSDTDIVDLAGKELEEFFEYESEGMDNDAIAGHCFGVIESMATRLNELFDEIEYPMGAVSRIIPDEVVEEVNEFIEEVVGDGN